MANGATETTSEKANPIENIVTHLVMLILGAIILWVGQTTFLHNGILRGLEQRVSDLKEEIGHLNEHIANGTADRFRKMDGLRLETQIDELTKIVYVMKPATEGSREDTITLAKLNTRINSLIEETKTLSDLRREMAWLHAQVDLKNQRIEVAKPVIYRHALSP